MQTIQYSTVHKLPNDMILYFVLVDTYAIIDSDVLTNCSINTCTHVLFTNQFVTCDNIIYDGRTHFDPRERICSHFGGPLDLISLIISFFLITEERGTRKDHVISPLYLSRSADGRAFHKQ